jgi:hypothetical protein
VPLDADDEAAIGECLRAAADGPFFPDWEFSTLFGYSRDEIRELADSWPAAVDDPAAWSAVNNSLLHLEGYPHGKWLVWHDWISVPFAEVRAVLSRWRGE